MYALTRAQMRRWEDATFAAGVGVLQVMELAGAEVAQAARRLAKGGPILVLAGKGNNGGDGLVAARRLHVWGCDVSVLCAGPPATPECEAAARAAQGAGVRFLMPNHLAPALDEAALVVDALLGFSLHGAPRGPIAGVIEAVNESGLPVLAVDLPSGVLADTGQAPGEAIRATHTLTLGAYKRGLLTEPGATLAGEVTLADIGLLHAPNAADEPLAKLVHAQHVQGWLPDLGAAIHKGIRGRVLLVAGSVGMAGAAALAAQGALRGGAGLVTVAVPAAIQPTVAGLLPEAMTVGLAAWEPASVLQLAAAADVVAIGPGLGRTPEVQALMQEVARRVAKPLVIDADGIFALAGQPELIKAAPVVDGVPAARVLTPHPREMGVLLGRETAAVQADRFRTVVEAATRTGAAVLLKGRHTLVAGPGRYGSLATGEGPPGDLLVNTSGSRALATAGSGDVLTGLIAALLAQGLPPTAAASAGAFLHGRAGELAAREIGPDGVLAGDIAARLPRVRRELQP